MTKIKLSKRLFEIARLVDKKSAVADIGCDHALVDIYLISNNIASKCIASDLRKTALKKAEENILKYNVKDIEIRCASGLDAIDKNDNVNTIIMAGLGSNTIISILNNEDKLKKVDTIIIQSNNHVDDIRKSVCKMGYYIEDEVLVLDKKIIYTIIKFKKGFKKYAKKEYLYGPILLKKKDNLFNKKIMSEINKNKLIIKKLCFKNICLKVKLHIKNILLKKEILK